METNDIIWSWSRANYTCLADFYQTYIWGDRGEPNGWNTLGSFCHDIVEAVAKEEMTQKEGLEMFKDNYWDVVEKHPFPATANWPDPEGSYYKKILPWFEQKKWWTGQVQSVEEHIVCTLPSGEKFQMYIDQMRTYRRQLFMTDFKVAKAYTGAELQKKIMQLLLYSYGYHQKYGKYPKFLEYKWFQHKFKPTVVPFNEAAMWKAVEFAEKRIVILKEKTKLAETEKGHFTPDALGDYYCNNICSHRNTCPFKKINN